MQKLEEEPNKLFNQLKRSNNLMVSPMKREYIKILYNKQVEDQKHMDF